MHDTCRARACTSGKGASWPSDDHVITMATAIKEPAEDWFVAIHAERTSPATCQVWLRLASRLNHAVAIALIALTAHGWWAHQDSNLEPKDYESSALTVEL